MKNGAPGLVLVLTIFAVQAFARPVPTPPPRPDFTKLDVGEGPCLPGTVHPAGYVCNSTSVWERQTTSPPLPRPRPASLSGASTPTPSPRPNVSPTPTNASATSAEPRPVNTDTAANQLSNCIMAGSAINASCSASNANTSAGQYSSQTLQTGQQMNAQQHAQVTDMCQQAAVAAASAASVIDGIVAQCSSAISSCSSLCSIGESSLNETQRGQLANARSQCYNGSNMMANLQAQSNQVHQSQARAQQCLADMGAASNQPTQATTPQTVAQNCVLNPNTPECLKLQEDCTNPQFAQSSEVCRCLNNNACSKRTASLKNEGVNKVPESSGESPTPQSADLRKSQGIADQNQMYESNLQDLALKPSASGPLVGATSKGANTPGIKKKAPSFSMVNTRLSQGFLSATSIRFGGTAGSPERGNYQQNGSWIPPRVNAGAAPNINVDQFRPNLNRKDFRAPAANNVQKDIYASHVDMWKQINLRYQSLADTLQP